MSISPPVLGIMLLLVGAIAFTLVWSLLRLIPRMRTGNNPQAAGSVQPTEGSNAILLVEPGGRLGYMNEPARQVFNLRTGEHANLEMLASRVRTSEEFLVLCAHEQQKRFSLNGKPLECASYMVPGTEGTMMVTLHRPTILSGMQATEADGAEALKMLSEFNQVVSADPSLEGTLKGILTQVERLIPAKILQIKLWTDVQEVFTVYQLTGDDADRILSQGNLERSQGFSEILHDKRQPLYLPDANRNPGGEAAGDIHSFIGVPLTVGNAFIGTLEAGLIGEETYTQEDFDVLQLIAPSAAIALRNSILLQERERREVVLSGMADLARVLGSAREASDLFPSLVKSLTPLFNVKTLGFLIYNESRGVLEAQIPFTGMPAQVVNLYQVPVTAGSPVEKSFLQKEVLLTQNAAEDEKWKDLGFQDYALAASWRDTALFPLVASDRSLGYLQISNHNDPEKAFTPEEMRLLDTVASEAAPIIENLFLVLQARQRMQRSESLRRIVNLANSPSNPDEVLELTSKEITRQLQADMAAIFLLDDTRGVLVLHENSLIGLVGEEIDKLRNMFVNMAQSRFSVTGSQQTYLSGKLASEDRLMTVYHPLVGQLRMESAVLVPLVMRGRSLGEMIIASRQADHFTPLDVQFVTTASSQLAATIDGLALRAQTDEDLRQQVEQLKAVMQVSREISSTTEGEYLLQVVFNEAMRMTKADCGSIMLFEGESDAPKAEPRLIFQLGDRCSEERLPCEKKVLRTGKAVLVKEYKGQGEIPAHEGIRSALVVPITHEGKVTGLIHLHSVNTGVFNQMMLDAIQTMAVQAAIALKNVNRLNDQKHRMEVLDQRADTVAQLSKTTNALNLERPLERSLEILAEGIREATPYQAVLISLINPETKVLHRVAGAGILPETFTSFKEHARPWKDVRQMLRREYRMGRGYFIPHEKHPEMPPEIELLRILPEGPPGEANGWHPEDILCFPIQDGSSEEVGLISLDAPKDGRRPEPAILEIIEIYAAQAALIIQNSHRLSEYKQLVDTLSLDLEQQQEANSISQAHLPTLLHKDLEQMIAIGGLEKRARRIRAGMEITETVNRQVDGPSALAALGREMLTRLEMNTAIIAENTSEGPRLTQVLGDIPRGASPEALFGQRNPLRACMQSGELILVTNVEQEDQWRDVPLLAGLQARSFVCLPITYEGKPVAGVLAISKEPLSTLTDEDRQVYTQIGRQVSIILQNIRLLTETRHRLREVNLLLDFSRQLSGLDARNILKALLDSALRVVSLAHAGAVLLHDPATGLLLPQVAGGYADCDSLMLLTYQPGESLPGQVFSAGKARRVDEVNFARDYTLPAEHLVNYREATGGRLPVSSLLLPIQSGERHLGVLVLDNFNTPAAFTPDDETLLLSLTQQVALSLENVRLFAETRRMAEELEQRVIERTAELTREQHNTETLLRIITEASSTLDLDRALNRTLSLLNDAIGAEQASILLVDEKDDTIHHRAGYGYMTPTMTEGSHPTGLHRGEGLAGWVITNRQSVCIPDVQKDERWLQLPSSSPTHRGVVASPLMLGEEAIGAVMAFHRQAGYFTPEQMGLVQAIGSQVSVAINNAKLYELIRDQADRLGSMFRNEQVEASRRQAILEAVADGVLVTDAENHITFFNPSAERILLLNASEMLGQSLDKVAELFGNASQTWMQTIRSWSEDAASHETGDTFAEQMELENGRVVLVHVAPVIWRAEFLGTVSIFRDITREVEVDRLKSEFVATVSHELRTPMTSIKGYVDLLLMGATGALNENQMHFLEIVQNNTNRLSVLVNDLLDISRIEAGRVSLSLGPLNLGEVVEEVCAEMRRRSENENKPMIINVNLEPGLPAVTGDVERIRQVVANLVDNAYNYTPAEGRIDIRLHQEQDMVQVDVQDNGIGIDPLEAGRVFERFYRGEDPLVLAKPGTGLGLSIVKQLVIMHRGEIWLESSGKPGEGSKFSFTLPVHKDEKQEVTK